MYSAISCLSIYPGIHTVHLPISSVYVSIYSTSLLIHQSPTWLFFSFSVHIAINLSPFIYLSIYVYIQYVCYLTCPFVCLVSINLFIHQFILTNHPSIYPSNHSLPCVSSTWLLVSSLSIHWFIHPSILTCLPAHLCLNYLLTRSRYINKCLVNLAFSLYLSIHLSTII